MKKSIIASIVLASLVSSSAFAVTDSQFAGLSDRVTTVEQDVKGFEYKQEQADKNIGLAQSKAEQAYKLANDADLAAEHAESKADQAVTAANKAEGIANNAATAVKNLEGKVSDNSDSIKNLQGDVELHEQAIATNKDDIKTNAKNIETNKQVAKDYTDQTAKQTLTSANTYTNEQVGIESAARIEGDRQTLQSANAYTNQKFAQLGKRIDKVRNGANAGTASALAASQIPQVEANGRFSLGAGVGTYNNQQAVAVGFSARVANNTVAKIAVTADTQHSFGAAAGVAVSW